MLCFFGSHDRVLDPVRGQRDRIRLWFRTVSPPLPSSSVSRKCAETNLLLCRFGTNLAAALLIWFFCYESKGLSLEAVDTMYSERGLKPWHSAKWVPAGYTDRKNRDEQYWIEHAKGNGNGEVKTTPTRLSDD